MMNKKVNSYHNEVKMLKNLLNQYENEYHASTGHVFCKESEFPERRGDLMALRCNIAAEALIKDLNSAIERLKKINF